MIKYCFRLNLRPESRLEICIISHFLKYSITESVKHKYLHVAAKFVFYFIILPDLQIILKNNLNINLGVGYYLQRVRFVGNEISHCDLL